MTIHRALLAAGEACSGLVILVTVLLLIVGIPALGIVACLFVGQQVAIHVGGGTAVLFGVALLCFAFLSAYVWHPYISGKITTTVEILVSRPDRSR